MKNQIKLKLKLKQKQKLNKQDDPPKEEGEEVTVKKPPTLEEKLAVQKEGWLQISSKSFMDESRYPVIKGNVTNSFKMIEMSGGYVSIADGPPAPEVAPGSYFRKNEKFKDGGPPSESAFYFRLSGLNLYYTATQADLIVLGAIKISNIDAVTPADTSYLGKCITVNDLESDQWTLCGEDIEDWECKIQTVLGLPCEKPQAAAEEANEELVKQPVIVINKPSPYCNEGWNYKEKGDDWQCLCVESNQQSPINLRKYCQMPGQVQDMMNKLNNSAIFQFTPVKTDDYQMVFEDLTVKMKCKEQPCKGSMAKIIDTDYNEFECNELRFKTPSEHTINGQQYPMEIQAFCNPLTQNAFRDKVVLAWLVENIPGGINNFIKEIDLLNLPHKASPIKKVSATNKDINLQGMFVNENVEAFYDYFSYYYYNGSLTNPQCDENVRWMVAADPIPLGISIYQMFNDANGKGIPNYKGNNRNIQPRNDRQVLFMDADRINCGKPIKMKDQLLDGKFETLNAKVYDIMYVPGSTHSQLKGSKMIDNNKYKKLIKYANYPLEVQKIIDEQ